MLSGEDLGYIKEGELSLTAEELLKVIAALRREAAQYASYRTENERAMTAMATDYQKAMKELSDARAELKSLKEALSHVSDKEKLKTGELFGRSTEKTADLLDSLPAEEEEDEAGTDTDAATAECHSGTGNGSHGKATGKSQKSRGKRANDLAGLPHERQYFLDAEALNGTYGDGNWRIAYWHCHLGLEHSPEVAYVLETYTPVISVGLGHDLHTVPYGPRLLEKSLLTASMASYVLFQKFFLAVPFYRLSLALGNLGVFLSRQTINNWTIMLAETVFSVLVDYMAAKLMLHPYHQCDETTLAVILDGRRAGRKSYIWLHMTSELLPEVPLVILYLYEKTRASDHLLEFYKDYSGNISCDGYCAYPILEEERGGEVTISGCLAHMRRKFADALLLVDRRGLSADAVRMLPESRILELAGKVYLADNALKPLSTEERLERRKTEVKPLMDALYAYIEGLDTDDPLMGAKLKEAVEYSKNQKNRLYRFLEDGNIPIDNSAAERAIKSLVIARKNFLQCTSIAGAQAVAILFSVVETAKANGANVYWYLRYVLEEMPRYLAGRKDETFLEKMMPWSDEYRRYEKERTSSRGPGPAENYFASPPKTPRKKDKDQASSAA